MSGLNPTHVSVSGESVQLAGRKGRPVPFQVEFAKPNARGLALSQRPATWKTAEAIQEPRSESRQIAPAHDLRFCFPVVSG